MSFGFTNVSALQLLHLKLYTNKERNSRLILSLKLK